MLRLYLREDLTHRLVADVKSGSLDAALMALPYDMAGLECAHVGDDELVAAVPAGHPLSRDERIDPASLDPDELILLEDGHCLRDHALAACEFPAAWRARDQGFAATSLATLVQMVGSGLGVSFLPAMAVDSGLVEGADIATRALKADAPQSRDRRRLARRFDPRGRGAAVGRGVRWSLAWKGSGRPAPCHRRFSPL